MAVIDPAETSQVQIQPAAPQATEKNVLDTVLGVITFFQVIKLIDGFDV